MLRLLYGCTSADFTITREGEIVGGVQCWAWSDRVGGYPKTDMLDLTGNPTAFVISDDDGRVGFYAAPGDVDPYWLDTGNGLARVAVRPVDLVLAAQQPVAQAYIHTQNTPSTSWSVEHYLGFQPNVTVVDTAGMVIIPSMTYLDANTVVLYFAGASAGKAYCS